MTIRARVFRKDGNRFLVPGLWYDEADPNWSKMSVSDILYEGLVLSVTCMLDAHNEWLDINTNSEGVADITNVESFVSGGSFAHGGFKVLLISGPVFDEAIKSGVMS